MKYGRLKKESPYLYNLAIINRQDQGNFDDPNDHSLLSTTRDGGNFDWHLSTEGALFWQSVYNGKFDQTETLIISNNYSII